MHQVSDEEQGPFCQQILDEVSLAPHHPEIVWLTQYLLGRWTHQQWLRRELWPMQWDQSSSGSGSLSIQDHVLCSLLKMYSIYLLKS